MTDRQSRVSECGVEQRLFSLYVVSKWGARIQGSSPGGFQFFSRLASRMRHFPSDAALALGFLRVTSLLP